MSDSVLVSFTRLCVIGLYVWLRVSVFSPDSVLVFFTRLYVIGLYVWLCVSVFSADSM